MYMANDKANNDALIILILFLLSLNPSNSHAKITVSNKRLILNISPPIVSNIELKTIIMMLDIIL